MKILVSLLVRGLAVALTGAVVPGVVVRDFPAAVVAAVVLGILNVLVKPVLVILTLPVTIVTLGLFTLVINTVVILMADKLVPGFEVGSFWTALLFGVVLSVVNWFLRGLEK